MSATTSQNVSSSTSQKVTEDSSTEDDSDKMPEQQPGVVENGVQLAAEPAIGAPVPPVTDKHQLQDQTNLLPFKQVIVIFMGLSCALFCESVYVNLI